MRFVCFVSALLFTCCAWGAAPPTGLEESAGGFAQVLTPRAFEFPKDHGPHPEFRHEWWYVTGNLDGPRGERFGFELTFFRVALVPLSGAGAVDTGAVDAAALTPNAATSGNDAGASHWRARQVYMAHFAITDVARRDFWATERYARDALNLAGAQPSPFRVWLEDWQIVEKTDGDWHLQASEGGRAISLDLHAETAPIPNGDHGMSRKASTLGAASYYYSIPRMTARGTISIDGESGGANASGHADGDHGLANAGANAIGDHGSAHTNSNAGNAQSINVSGLAWLDREWGSGSLGVDAQGWDWFALQLADNRTLMFYQLRNRDGSRDKNSAGTWVDTHGVARSLTNDDVLIEPQTFWNSPRGGRYPASWKITVISLNLTFIVTPVLANQELPTNPRYWEGAVDVKYYVTNGTAFSVLTTGRGYVELVGYANERRD